MEKKTTKKKAETVTKGRKPKTPPITKDPDKVGSSQAIATQSEQVAEPPWHERLDACLTDEFRYELDKLLSSGVWTEVKHGLWVDRIEFFKYLDWQVGLAYLFRKSPIKLKTHFSSLNPTGQQVNNTGGPAADFARLHLPLNRQQVFLLNAVRLIIENRDNTEPELRRAGKIISELLNHKIGETFRFLADLTGNRELYDLSNVIDAQPKLKDKANATIRFLGEVLSTNGLMKPGNLQETLLFVKKQRETPPELNTDQVLVHQNAFKGDFALESYCNALYWEAWRLLELATLEGLEHKHQVAEVEENQKDKKYFEPRNEKQVFLALEFIFRQLKATASDTAKAKVMSFLSGYSWESLRKAFSEKNEWKNLQQDLHEVRAVLVRAKMAAMVNRFDEEISELDK